MSLKLQNILLKLANDVLDLEKSGKTLGEPIDEAERAILGLLDKSLPEEKFTLYVPNEAIAEIWRKEYPSWTIKLSQRIPDPPSKKLLAIKAKLTTREDK